MCLPWQKKGFDNPWNENQEKVFPKSFCVGSGRRRERMAKCWTGSNHNHSRQLAHSLLSVINMYESKLQNNLAANPLR